MFVYATNRGGGTVFLPPLLVAASTTTILLLVTDNLAIVCVGNAMVDMFASSASNFARAETASTLKELRIWPAISLRTSSYLGWLVLVLLVVTLPW